MDAIGEYFQKHWAWLIAALLTLIAVVINQWITSRRSKRALTCWVVTNSRLTDRKEPDSKELQAKYADQPLWNLRIVEVEIRNTGSLPLLPADFHEPLTLLFPNAGSIIDPEVVRARPEGFNPEIETVDTTIWIKPTLMNPRDTFIIKALVTGFSNEEPTVKGRVAGIPAVRAISMETSMDWSAQAEVKLAGFFSLWVLVPYAVAGVFVAIARHFHASIGLNPAVGATLAIGTGITCSFLGAYVVKGLFHNVRRWWERRR